MPSVFQKETQYQIDHIHDNRINESLVSNSICIGLAAIAVLLRFAARRLSSAKIAADDFMIVAASVRYCCVLASAVMLIIRPTIGLGYR